MSSLTFAIVLWTSRRSAFWSAEWVKADEAAMVEDEKLIVVQVNGKVRGKVTVAADADEETVKTVAFADENVKKFTDNTQIVKVIYVPGKLLNVVVKPQ